MREMLDELMDESVAQANTTNTSMPAVNISQNDHEVLAEMSLPGFTRDDITLELGEDFLTVSGNKKIEARESADGQFFRREFSTQSFTRTVSLPALVQTDNAKADMKHGILSVHLPKIVEEKPKTKRLEISAE